MLSYRTRSRPKVFQVQRQEERETMNRLLLALLVFVTAGALLAKTETWTNVSLVDSMCADKMKANADEHKKDCAMKCGKTGGFSVVTSDGTVMRLDSAGNKKALAALEKSKKEDHLRATVTGEKTGDTIKVKSIKLD